MSQDVRAHEMEKVACKIIGDIEKSRVRPILQENRRKPDGADPDCLITGQGWHRNLARYEAGQGRHLEKPQQQTEESLPRL